MRIERPIADDSLDGAGSGTWEAVAEVRADIQDSLPSRGERLADGISVATRPSRVRISYRPDVKPSMRCLIGRYVGEPDALEWVTDRIVQIITEPAEIGHREGIEFMVESYSVAGNPA